VEVLDRYLQAVRHWLPSAQQDDILAELSEDIRSEVEEQEAAAGRRLQETELAAILKRRGHPMWVAEGYLPQRHLIGPALLPVYARVLKVTLASLVAIFGALFATFAFVVDVPPRPELASPGFWLWYAALYGFAHGGFLTLLFALIERSQVRARAGDAWDPRRPWDLPRLPDAAGAGENARVRVAATGQLLGAGIFALWWLDVLTLGPLPGLSVRLAPVWTVLYWPILLCALGTVALAAATLVRPHVTRLGAAARLVCDLLGLGVAVTLLFHAGSLVELGVDGAPPAGVAEVARWVNVSVAVTVVVFAVSYLVAAVRDVRRAMGRPDLRPRALRLLAGD